MFAASCGTSNMYLVGLYICWGSFVGNARQLQSRGLSDVLNVECVYVETHSLVRSGTIMDSMWAPSWVSRPKP